MSNSIDQRIVEMTFDNSQFERGVESTLESLKNLESSMELKDGVGGLEKAKQVVENISFAQAETEVSGFGKVLENLKSVASNVFTSIADGVGSFVKGITIAKGIFNTGIGAMAVTGGWSRASNLNKAAFKLDSMGIGWENVTSQVQKSVDGTAYSLDAAASAAAMFASAGVQVDKALAGASERGDQMQQALVAVSNLASVSGSSFEQMADIFTKVAAQGKLTGRQVESLAFASVDAAGMFRRQLGWSAEEFADAQRKGLIDFQTFIDVVNAEYGEAAALANNSFDGALANMRSALNRTLATFFQYGQTAMIPMFNAIRMWINTINDTLKPLIGTWTDLNGVVQKGILITGFTDIMSEAARAVKIFGGSWKDAQKNVHYWSNFHHRTSRIMQMLADGLKGPVEEITAGTNDLVWALLQIGATVREILRLAMEALSPVGMAFHDIFGDKSFAKAMKTFHQNTERILDTIAEYHMSAGYINLVRAAFQTLFTTVRGVGTVVFNAIGDAINFAFDTLSSFGLMLGGVFDILYNVVSSGESISDSFGEIFKPIYDYFSNVPVIGDALKLFGKIPEGIKKFGDAVSGKEGAFESLSEFLNGLDPHFSGIANAVGNGLTLISTGFKGFAESFKAGAADKAAFVIEKLKDIGQHFSGVVDAVKPWAKKIGDSIGGVFSSLSDHFPKIPVADKIMSVFGKLPEGIKLIGDAVQGKKGAFEHLNTFFDSLKPEFASIAESVGKGLGFIGDGLNAIKDVALDKVTWVIEKLEAVGTFLAPVADTIKNVFLGIGDALADAFNSMDLNLDPFLEFFGSVGNALREFFSSDTDRFDFGKLVGKISEAVGNLSSQVLPQLENFGKAFKQSVEENFAEPLENIRKNIESISKPFSDLQGMFSGLTLSNPFEGSQVLNAGASESSGIVAGYDGITDMAVEAGNKLNDTGNALTNTFSILSTLLDFFAHPMDAIKKGISDTLSTVGSSLSSGLSNLIADIPLEGLEDFVSRMSAVGLNVSVMVGIVNLSNFFGRLADIFGSIKGSIDALTKIFGEIQGSIKSARNALRIHMVLEFAAAVAIMVGALMVLATTEDPSKLAAVLPYFIDIIGLLAGTIAIFGFLSGFGANAFSFATVQMAATAMLELAVAVGIISLAMKSLANTDSDQLEQGLDAIMQVLYMFAAITLLMGRGFGGVNKGGSVGAAFLAMSVSIVLMSMVVKKMGALAEEDPGKLEKGLDVIRSIAAIYIVLAAMMSLLSGIGGGGGKSSSVGGAMLAMTVSIIAVYKVMEQLSVMDRGDLEKATEALGVIVLAISLLMIVMTLVESAGSMGSKSSALSLVALGVVVAALGGALYAITEATKGGGDVVTAMAALAVGIIAIAGAMFIMSRVAPLAATSAPGLIVLAIAIAIFTAAALAMTKVVTSDLATGLFNMLITLAAFSGALAIIGIACRVAAPGLLLIARAFQVFGLAMLAIGAAILLAGVGIAILIATAPALVDAMEKVIPKLQELITMDVVKLLAALGFALIPLGAGLALFAVGLLLLEIPLMLMTLLTEDAAKSMLGFFNTVTEHREEFTNGIHNLIMTVIDALGMVGGELLTRGGEFVGSLVQGIDAHKDEIRAAFEKAFQVAIDALGSMIMGAGTWIGEQIEKYILPAIDGALQKAGETLVGFGNGLGSSGGEYFGGFEGAMSMDEWYNEHVVGDPEMPKTSAALDQVANKVTEKVNENKDKLAETQKQAVADVDTQLAESEPITDIATKFGITDEQFAAASAKFSELTNGLSLETFAQFTESFSGQDWGINFGELVGADGLDMEMLNGLLDNGAIDAAQSWGSSMNQEFSTIDITGFIAGQDKIDFNAIKDQFGEAGKLAVGAFADNIKEGIDKLELGPNIESVAKSIQQEKAFKSAGETDAKAAVEGLETAKKGMRSAGVAAGEAAAAGVSSTKGSAYSSGYAVGNALSRGVADGLASALGSIRANAASIISEIDKVARKKGEIKSPSRMTARIGRYIGLGLVVGMNSTRNEIADSATGMVEAGQEAALRQASYLSAFLSDIDDNPTIRPVLDLTEYEAGIRRMKTLNAGAPMSSAQWANRLSPTEAAGGYYNSRSSTINISLNYGAGTSAADMVNEMAGILQTKTFMEA